MASIESRVTALEQATEETEYVRPLTDAERAVRLLRILNGPDTQKRREVMEFLERTGHNPGNVEGSAT